MAETRQSVVYGYARISTNKQKIERQIKNIKGVYPDAIIVEEIYTGTKTDGRKKLKALLKRVEEGDTIIFDEVSRMSRNACEGIELYKELFEKGVNLEFIKEPHINTSVYKANIDKQMQTIATGNKTTDKLIDSIMNAIHDYTIDLATEQIELAFKNAQNEVEYLRQRTKEGMKANGATNTVDEEGNTKQGSISKARTGNKYETTKSKDTKELMLLLTLDFNKDNKKGKMNDKEFMKKFKLARNTYYKYKRELKAQLETN